MPLSVNYIYEFCQNLIRKNQSVGIDSVEFAYHWNTQSFAFQNDLLGPFQARNNGKTGANTGLIEDETILQKLSPFTIPGLLAITSGNAVKPSDFIYRLALRINGVDCYKITHSQIANVNADVIDPPSIETNTYYFVEYQTGYYFLPHTLPTTDITTAELDYVSTPNLIFWAYTYDDDNRKVYDPINSIDSLWDDLSQLEITKRMLKTIGVSLHDKDFEGFGQSVITTAN